MHTTPASLLERLRRAGDQHDWDHLVAYCTPFLIHWARRRLGMTANDADDLVQEVLLVLVKKLPTFHYKKNGSFRGWLRKIMHNKWIDQHRGWQPPREPGGEGMLTELAAPADENGLWDTEYRQHLVQCALTRIRTDFEERTWMAFWELVVLGRPAAEVASALGMTVGAVYTAKCRVLRRLRRELDGMLD